MMEKNIAKGKFLKSLRCVAAMDLKRGIGKNNNLPWNLRKEMKYFQRITSQVQNEDLKNAVVMGRKTWQSFPKKFKFLPNRINFVLSKTLSDVPPEIIVKPSLTAVMEAISGPEFINKIENVFIIGGYSVYKEAIESGFCDRIYLTHVMKEFDCDTFFPEFDDSMFKRVSDPDVPEEIQEENGIQYEYRLYQCC